MKYEPKLEGKKIIKKPSIKMSKNKEAHKVLNKHVISKTETYII